MIAMMIMMMMIIIVVVIELVTSKGETFISI